MSIYSIDTLCASVHPIVLDKVLGFVPQPSVHGDIASRLGGNGK